MKVTALNSQHEAPQFAITAAELAIRISVVEIHRQIESIGTIEVRALRLKRLEAETMLSLLGNLGGCRETDFRPYCIAKIIKYSRGPFNQFVDYKTNTLILKKEIQDYYQDKILEEVEEFFLLNKSPDSKTKNTENAQDKSLSENEGISDYIADTFHKQTECTQNKDSTYDKNETKYVNKIEHETKHETESQVVSGLYENSSDVIPQNMN